MPPMVYSYKAEVLLQLPSKRRWLLTP